MSVDTDALELTASEQTILTVPENNEGPANAVRFHGAGDLTLKYRKGATGKTFTLYDAKSITEEFVMPGSFNIASGDQLIASGDGLTAFVSRYYVGASQGSAVLAFGPGPQELQSGDMDSGYFGEVSAAEFYSGDRLALELGVTEGVLQNSEAGYFKVADRGNVMLIPKKSFMHSVSYDHLYERGLVYGVDGPGSHPRGTPTNQYTTVSHGGNRFLVRNLTGAHADPFAESDSLFFTDDMCEQDVGADSEWNRIMYRLCEDDPTCPPTTDVRIDRHGGPQSGDNWASFTKSEMGLTGSGRATWCQEASDTTERSRVGRGSRDVAYFGRTSANYTLSYRGWRPAFILETSR